MGYKGRDHDTKTLSYSTVRDLQRLGHLGLGKKAYWELARILCRDGVVFPAGGVKAAWDEKWIIFGEIFAPVSSKIEPSTDESAKAKLYPSNKFTERAHSQYRFTYAYKWYIQYYTI